MKPQPIWEEDPSLDSDGETFCGRYQYVDQDGAGVEIDIHKPKYQPGEHLEVAESYLAAPRKKLHRYPGITLEVTAVRCEQEDGKWYWIYDFEVMK